MPAAQPSLQASPLRRTGLSVLKSGAAARSGDSVKLAQSPPLMDACLNDSFHHSLSPRPTGIGAWGSPSTHAQLDGGTFTKVFHFTSAIMVAMVYSLQPLQAAPEPPRAPNYLKKARFRAWGLGNRVPGSLRLRPQLTPKPQSPRAPEPQSPRAPKPQSPKAPEPQSPGAPEPQA